MELHCLDSTAVGKAGVLNGLEIDSEGLSRLDCTRCTIHLYNYRAAWINRATAFKVSVELALRVWHLVDRAGRTLSGRIIRTRSAVEEEGDRIRLTGVATRRISRNESTLVLAFFGVNGSGVTGEASAFRRHEALKSPKIDAFVIFLAISLKLATVLWAIHLVITARNVESARATNTGTLQKELLVVVSTKVGDREQLTGFDKTTWSVSSLP
mmetsp:Transcript_18901/g.34195  ORF Transcript_18901/g.34195 Transcript_18901/m.34195 type:complete len:212 (+) Transcript_18901:537-1172(+)